MSLSPVLLQQARHTLAHASEGVVVGPRPIQNRRSWAAGLWGMAKVTMATLALGTGLAGGMIASGLSQEIEGQLSPALDAAWAPAQMAWVQMPTSPFVQAGQTQTGFSLEQALEQWRLAGMTAEQAQQAVPLFQSLRPVVLGRADALLEAELRMEAAQAARALATQFPDVAQRLQAGDPVAQPQAWSVEWTKVLAQIQDQAWVDPPASGSWEEGVARLEAAAQLSPEDQASMRGPQWLTHQVATALWPALEAGKDARGQWEPLRMVEQWQAQGMDGELAWLEWEAVQAAVEQARQDPHQRAYETALAQWMPVLEEVRSWEALAKNPRPVSERLDAERQALLYQDLRWEIEEWRQRMASPSTTVARTQAQAQAELAAAMEETGLRSITFAWNQVASPQALFETAQRLRQANAALEKATGWQGQVLGLSGRLEWVMGSPDQRHAAKAAVKLDNSGRYQMVSDWGSLSHEWFHVFDYAAARVGIVRPEGATLSRELRPLRQFHAPAQPLVQAMKQLHEGLTDGSPRWQAEREHANEITQTRYWTRPSEVIAFAFENFVAGQQPGSAFAISDHARDNPMESHRYPRASEGAGHAPLFQAFFAAAEPMALHIDTGPGGALGMNHWSARRGLAPEEVATLRVVLRGERFK